MKKQERKKKKNKAGADFIRSQTVDSSSQSVTVVSGDHTVWHTLKIWSAFRLNIFFDP